MAKAAIVKLEDQQLELMEQAEAAQKQANAAGKLAEEARQNMEKLAVDLGAREENLKKELAGLESNREELAAAVDEAVLSRYERLRKSKGQNGRGGGGPRVLRRLPHETAAPGDRLLPGWMRRSSTVRTAAGFFTTPAR